MSGRSNSIYRTRRAAKRRDVPTSSIRSWEVVARDRGRLLCIINFLITILMVVLRENVFHALKEII